MRLIYCSCIAHGVEKLGKYGDSLKQYVTGVLEVREISENSLDFHSEKILNYLIKHYN